MNARSLARLFDRIPNEIVLSVASRDLDLSNGARCLCGWTIRESIARSIKQDADDVVFNVWTIERQLADAFGGRAESWGDVFGGVTITEQLPVIETAWVDRLDRAVRHAR